MRLLKSIFFLVLLVAFAAWAPVNPGYNVGDTVNDFKLKNIDGKFLSLADFKDAKGVILIFDCNTCPFSKAYNDRILALDAKYRSLGYPVVAINSNDPVMSPGDSYEEMIEHAKSKGYTFPYLFDEKQDVAKAFGATNTPHVFVLKKESDAKFVVSYTGGIDNNARDAEAADKKYVEEAVDALINNKDIATKKTKAIGCGIKWKKS